MIVSFTYGRIRARLTHLQGQDAPDISIESIKGIKNITVNPMTGSVLLEYDPELIAIETIASFLEPIDPEGAATLRNPDLLKPRSIFPRPVSVPLELLDESSRPTIAQSRRANRPTGSSDATAELVNMTVGFLSVVFSAFWGTRKSHVLFGAGFGVMVIQHIWKYRKRLRPINQMSWVEILGLDIPSFAKSQPIEIEETTQEQLEYIQTENGRIEQTEQTEGNQNT
jgi:hypothetical protein